MKSKLIEDVEAFAEQMRERIPNTNEGGIIILAVDDHPEGQLCEAIIARPSHRKRMILEILQNEEIQKDIVEILSQ